MTDPRPRLLTGAGRIHFLDGVVATFSDDGGSLKITVTRETDSWRPGTAAAEPLMIVAVDGEIDQDTAPLLRLVLAQTLNGRTPVCCDLSATTFFGAAAANVVLVAHRQATELGHIFFLRGVRGLADRVLAVADRDRVVPRCRQSIR